MNAIEAFSRGNGQSTISSINALHSFKAPSNDICLQTNDYFTWNQLQCRSFQNIFIKTSKSDFDVNSQLNAAGWAVELSLHKHWTRMKKKNTSRNYFANKSIDHFIQMTIYEYHSRNSNLLYSLLHNEQESNIKKKTEMFA